MTAHIHFQIKQIQSFSSKLTSKTHYGTYTYTATHFLREPSHKHRTTHVDNVPRRQFTLLSYFAALTSHRSGTFFSLLRAHLRPARTSSPAARYCIFISSRRTSRNSFFFEEEKYPAPLTPFVWQPFVGEIGSWDDE